MKINKIFSVLNIALGFLAGAIITFIFGLISTGISSHSAASADCEYQVIDPVPAIQFEDNLDKISKLTINDKPQEKIYVTKIFLLNRTNKSFDNFTLNINLNNFTNSKSELIHKLVTYPDRYSGGIVEWIDSKDQGKLILKFAKFDSSWDLGDSLVVRLFILRNSSLESPCRLHPLGLSLCHMTQKFKRGGFLDSINILKL